MQASDLDKCKTDDQGRPMVLHRPSNGLKCVVIGVDGDCLWVFDANTHDFGNNRQRFSANVGEFDPLTPATAEREIPSLVLDDLLIEPTKTGGIRLSVVGGKWVYLGPDYTPLLRDWLNTHYPAPPVPACPTSGAPAPDAGEAQVISNAIADPTYCPYCLRCKGLVRMRKIAPFYWRCVCGAEHDARSLVKASPTPPASPPAPVTVDVEGIIGEITKLSDRYFRVPDKSHGDGFESAMIVAMDGAWIRALREHLPSLAEGARLMRLVEKGIRIWKGNSEWLVDHSRLPRIGRYPDLPSALAAAEQIGGA